MSPLTPEQQPELPSLESSSSEAEAAKRDRFFGRGDSVIPPSERITFTWDNIKVKARAVSASKINLPGIPKREARPSKMLLKGGRGGRTDRETGM